MADTLQSLQGYAAATIDAFWIIQNGTVGANERVIQGRLLEQMQRAVERMGPDAAQGPWLGALVRMTAVHAGEVI